MARAVARVIARAALVPVSVFTDGSGIDAIRSDRAVQRRGYSRVLGITRCPQFRAAMKSRCVDGAPRWVMLSQRQDAVLGEGNCSYGPTRVTDRYERWRWQVVRVDLTELGESLTLVRWQRRP